MRDFIKALLLFSFNMALKKVKKFLKKILMILLRMYKLNQLGHFYLKILKKINEHNSFINW